jgi:hypothetical protein
MLPRPGIQRPASADVEARGFPNSCPHDTSSRPIQTWVGPPAQASPARKPAAHNLTRRFTVRSVPVRAESALHQCFLVVRLGGVHLRGGSAGPEHAQEAENEVPGMVCLRPCSFPGCTVMGKLAEDDVPGVAVARVDRPTAENALGAVGLADVLSPKELLSGPREPRRKSCYRRLIRGVLVASLS